MVSKIFENVIGTYVDSSLSPFYVDSGRGTVHNMHYYQWRISLDKGGYGGAVLTDLSEAFDTLNHDLLIAKLHAYGFDKNALKPLKSFL